jgi:hypothetical protein
MLGGRRGKQKLSGATRAGLRTWWALGHCRKCPPPPPFPAEVHHQTATFVGAKQ